MGKERAPLTTVALVVGDSPADRKDQLRTVLAHATNHCGERWLVTGDYGFEANVDRAHEKLENNEPGQPVSIEENDWRGEVSWVRICTSVNGIIKGTTKNDGRYDIIVPGPDVLCSRSEGTDRIDTIVNDGNSNLHFAALGLTVQAGTDITGSTRRAIIAVSDVMHPSHDPDSDHTWSWSGGRPPIGFEVADDGGRLVQSDNYDDVCRRLQQYLDGEISQRRAAKFLDCARATIDNAVEKRPEMYALEK